MPSSPDLTGRIAAAQRAVRAQTELLHREFGRVASQWKEDGTRVTAADLAISEGIFRELRAAFPEDDYCSEETAGFGRPVPLRARFAWVLDPIDGTNNFALGIALCAISLALLEDGRPVYGAVYDHARRVLMHGGPGRGLRDGDRMAQAGRGAPHGQSLVGLHSPYERERARSLLPVIENFKIRGLGSSTLHLAYVGAGILDGLVDHNVKVWDIAAAHALAAGGGAETQFLNGDPFPLRTFDLKMPRIHYVAGSAAMCARLRELLGS